MQKTKSLKTFLEEIGLTEKEVNLERNPPSLRLSNKQITEEKLIELAQILEGNNWIQHLYLTDNEIGDEGAIELFKILNSTAVTEIHLHGNKIGNVAIEELAKVLLSNDCKLKWIDLSLNQIGDKGAIAIAKILPNIKVERINLIHNDIRNEGVTAFAKALKGNTILKQIAFCDNEIGDEGAKAFTTALKADHVLENFCLGSNNIENSVYKELIEACESKGKNFDSVIGGYSNFYCN